MKKKLQKQVSSGKKAGRARGAGAADDRDAGASGSRPEPDVERWFTAAKAEFPPSRSSIIPMLQSAQAALSYLPREAIRAIARHVGAAPAVVEGVASFYAQFRFHKPGRHRVTVCGGTACYVRGSGKLMDELQADLKVVPGGTTADGAITLDSVACFGACALAPVVVIDGKVSGRVSSNSLKALMGATEKPAGAARRGKPGT